MSLNPLDNPLERLATLPNAMNWKGVWNNTTQYYRNDVVLSPLDTASYIALNVSVLGGADPALNLTDWIVLSPAAGGGITGLTAGLGISLTGTPTIPQINNTGVLQVVAGTGITNVGTAEDPELRNTGLLSLNVGSGLTSTGGQTPTITNAGVLQIGAGAGISVSGPSNAPTLANTGVLFINSGGAGIAVNNAAPFSTQSPQIVNTGVNSITAGAGIAVDTTAPFSPQNPQITLTAVASPPIMTFMVGSTAGLIPPASAAGVVVLLSPTSVLAQHLLNGSPDPNGVWVLDMGVYSFYNDAPAGGTDSVLLSIEDITTPGGPYIYGGMPGTSTTTLSGAPPYFFPLNKFYIDVAAARATGLRHLDLINVINDTGGNLTNVGWAGIVASYYPNGIE